MMTKIKFDGSLFKLSPARKTTRIGTMLKAQPRKKKSQEM
jgi:hypothetical protein